MTRRQSTGDGQQRRRSGAVDQRPHARARFSAALTVIAAGALMALSAFTLGTGSQRWIAFAAGCGALLVLMAAFALPGRGAAQRWLDLPLALVCIWSIVCSRAIESSGAGASAVAVKWLTFSAGVAIFGFGLVSLVMHELRLERQLRSARRPHMLLTSASDGTRHYGDAPSRTTG